MRTPRGLTVVIAVTLTALLATASAQAGVVTKTAHAALTGGGTVTATVSYTPKSFYDTGARLTITRAGTQLLRTPVTSRACHSDCSVQAIRAADIEENGEPVIMLDLYTGGAHCCYLTNFYTYDPGTQTYRPYEYEWGDPGYKLTKLAGRSIFETDDDRFAYVFTDYAASGMPLQYFSFNGQKLVNVTTQYPGAIARNAAFWLKTYRSMAAQKWDDSVGLIAAWAADEDLLGHAEQVAAFLAAEAKAGHLNSGVPGMAGGAKFVAELDTFLRKTGYLTSTGRRPG